MAGNQFYGTIPGIAQAYQNDPRTRLAASMLQTGMSTAPVAQGGWAVTDGLARAAQAIAGAVINKSQDKKYAAREADYMKGLQGTAALASTPQPAAMAPQANFAPPPTPVDPMGAAATALGGQGAPQGANMAAPAPSLPPMARSAPQPALAAGGPMAAMSAATSALRSPQEYYQRGIRPIEGGTDPRTGAFRTSPKGAVGPGQIMPGTGPEAARLAGLPWDEKRFRSDTAYNDALGNAYFAKQLETFGDPLKAAAAYNAGPGRVRRALRRAASTGTDFTQHLPAETQDYVTKFAAATGGTGAVSLPGNAATGIAPPTMEAVPGAMEVPAQAPQAPELPAEVSTNRIAMAQQLLQSGNPDLAAMAQSYLDKGLDEQNAARTLRSGQEFTRGQTGYTAALNDFTDARSTARNAQVQDRRDAAGRNFSRETRFADQTFQAGQAAVGREYQTETREDQQQFQAEQTAGDRAFQAEQARINRTWQSEEAQKNRDNKLSVAAQRSQSQANRNAYFSTPTGLKMQKDAGDAINLNNDAISKYQRFMDLNNKQSTGGIALNTPLVAGAYSAFDSDLREMNSIANDTTLAKIGGSLGTAISDGDRSFIQDSNIGTNAPRTSNTNIARATIGALRRKNDYITEFANAQADNTAAQFGREWSLFAQSVPIVKRDARGNAVANDKPMTFAEWKASRPRYDANGKRVN